MSYGTCIRELCRRLRPQDLAINERKLVLFGVLEGLIRRVYKIARFGFNSFTCDCNQSVPSFNSLIGSPVMSYGTCIRELCRRLRPQDLAINERKLVLFGVLEGLIRRVYKQRRRSPAVKKENHQHACQAR
ncbi:unnamed protein product [Plutella xylostella]|uniref:(diamondback moth) hypothetical protein n=1 Tax=Plutella xylostella TaxID=51655 RepID=A0A8S4DUI7_PLUXY|nr:unnamed protein product [Plutella xylostella]